MLSASPEALKYWTAIIVGWQVILSNWKMPGELTFQDWVTEFGKAAA